MVYNVNLEAKIQFSFPIEVVGSAEAERTVCELCGMREGTYDDEVKAVLEIVEEFAEERFGRNGEVVSNNLILCANITPEEDFLEESVESGLLRLHPTEAPQLVTPERIHLVLGTMKDRAVLMEVPGTSCYILYDDRCTIQNMEDKYLVGALYVVGKSGGYFCLAKKEELQKIKVIMTNRRMIFNSENVAIPVFRLS